MKKLESQVCSNHKIKLRIKSQPHVVIVPLRQQHFLLLFPISQLSLFPCILACASFFFFVFAKKGNTHTNDVCVLSCNDKPEKKRKRSHCVSRWLVYICVTMRKTKKQRTIEENSVIMYVYELRTKKEKEGKKGGDKSRDRTTRGRKEGSSLVVTACNVLKITMKIFIFKPSIHTTFLLKPFIVKYIFQTSE